MALLSNNLTSIIGLGTGNLKLMKYRKIKTKLASITGTIFKKWLGVSDKKRWQYTTALSESWDARTRQIAAIIPPDALTVIEFGAGRMLLGELLPEGCEYTPSDIVARGTATLVVDLNSRSLPPFADNHVAVFSGVLEYVFDVQRLVSHLSKSVKVFVVSYAPTENYPNTLERRSHGWVNDFSISQLNEIFRQANFVLDSSTVWRDQIITKYVSAKNYAGRKET